MDAGAEEEAEIMQIAEAEKLGGRQLILYKCRGCVKQYTKISTKY